MVDDPPPSTPGADFKDHQVLVDDQPLKEDSETCEDRSWEAWFEDAAASGFPGSEEPPSAPPASKRPHVVHNSGKVEWYTPVHIIEAARTAMGCIDVDPASCALANTVVKAATYYTADDDGLAHPWQGRVWLNPPYARGVISLFVAGLIVRLDAGEVEEACVLVNAATETRWAQMLLARSSAVCFPKGRLRFWSPSGPKGLPLQGQMVAYLGHRPDAFVEAFRDVGAAWRRRPRSAGLRG